MDVTETIAPKSDQVNADDLHGGPRTFTIAGVTRGDAEQPLNVKLTETDRYYRPSKSMRRVLVALYGKESDGWIGKRITLYRDPSVRFGKDEVGGIKISHASDIDRPKAIALTVKRGKREPHTIKPLPADAPTSTEPLPATIDDINAATSIDELRGMWDAAGPQMREAISARVAELQSTEGRR